MKTDQILTHLRMDFLELIHALRTWRFWRTLLAMAVGVTMGAVAINDIMLQWNLFAPGTTGISLFLYYLLDWPDVAGFYILLNIPLFIIGWREYALKFVVISLIGVFMFSGALELTANLNLIRITTEDPLMASILAGVLMGAGSGLYLRYGGSAGGMDILATFIKKRIGLTMGTTMNTVNAFNLMAAWLMFDLQTAFYSGLFMLVNTWTLDRVQTGFSQRQAVFILTTRPNEVASEVMRRLDRGVTFFHATGGFSQVSEMVVYSVINPYQLGQLKALLYETDEDALLVVYNTSEVIGSQFLTWEEQGYRRPRKLAVDATTPHVEAVGPT